MAAVLHLDHLGVQVLDYLVFGSRTAPFKETRGFMSKGTGTPGIFTYTGKYGPIQHAWHGNTVNPIPLDNV